MSEPPESKALPKPIDAQAALVEAIQLLDTLSAQYALIGGIALSYYGLERYTKDIDFVVDASTSAAAQTANADKEPRPLRIGGVPLMTSSGVRVDLIDRREEYKALYTEALSDAVKRGPRVRLNEHLIPVASLSYLVALKQVAGRPQDEADLAFLLRLRNLNHKEAREIVYRHAGDFAARWLDKQARLAGRADAPKDYDPEDS